MRKLTPYKFKVQDRHTGVTVKRYIRQADAQWSADKLCELWGKGRYIVIAL